MSVFDGVPPYNGVDINDWILRARLVINGILNGKTNNTGSFTLNAASATTTITLAKGRLGPDTVILLQPKTANAAAEFPTMWESARDVANGTFTFTHTNNAQIDRTFGFVLVG